MKSTDSITREKDYRLHKKDKGGKYHHKRGRELVAQKQQERKSTGGEKTQEEEYHHKRGRVLMAQKHKTEREY